jgi:hypothetical protein
MYDTSTFDGAQQNDQVSNDQSGIWIARSFQTEDFAGTAEHGQH